MSTTTKEEISQRLRVLPIFADMDDGDLETLSRLVVLRTMPKGAFIVAQNEPGDAMYLLLSGRVKISLASPEGKELALDYLDAPSHFGETALTVAGPHSADIIAMTEVEVLVLDAKDFSTAIQIQPQLALSLIATLSHRLRSMIIRLEDMAFQDARHRVMRVLLNVATASYETKGVPVVEGFTHYEIATLAGTSRETTSRVISSLGREGVLATKNRHIVVDLFKMQEAFQTG